MKVGDLVRCKTTKAVNTVGVVTKIEKAIRPAHMDAVHVLTDGRICRWSIMRLEVINESR